MWTFESVGKDESRTVQTRRHKHRNYGFRKQTAAQEDGSQPEQSRLTHRKKCLHFKQELFV